MRAHSLPLSITSFISGPHTHVGAYMIAVDGHKKAGGSTCVRLVVLFHGQFRVHAAEEKSHLAHMDHAPRQ